MPKFLILFLMFASALRPAQARETPFQTLSYPATGQPTVQFTFSKFKLLTGGPGKEHGYVTDATAENMTSNLLATLNLRLFVFDKAGARIGEGSILLTSVAPHQTVKFEITVYATGTPASLAVADVANGPRTVSVTVNSVPQGAALRLDGKDQGTTPKLVEVPLGKHMLDFSKDGFTSGHFPIEMGPRDTSGGSVTYELGTAGHDTVELRDGSVLSGDVLAVTTTEVQVRIGGATQTFDRNQVKRILLTPRDSAQ